MLLQMNLFHLKLSEKDSHLSASETRLNEILARDASEAEGKLQNNLCRELCLFGGPYKTVPL